MADSDDRFARADRAETTAIFLMMATVASGAGVVLQLSGHSVVSASTLGALAAFVAWLLLGTVCRVALARTTDGPFEIGDRVTVKSGEWADRLGTVVSMDQAMRPLVELPGQGGTVTAWFRWRELSRSSPTVHDDGQ